MKEWKEVGAEYLSGQELSQVPDEYSNSMPEFNDVPPEHITLPDEYENNTGSSMESRKSSGKKKKKFFKKMSYMVAATLSVAVMGQTIATMPDISTEILTPSETDDDLEQPIVPDSDDEPEPPTPGNDDEPVASGEAFLASPDTGEYEFYLGNGGVIAIHDNDYCFGLMDYQGNIILEPTYNGGCSVPNDNGYIIFSDEAGYRYIVGPDGATYKYETDVIGLEIGEENIVSYGIYDPQVNSIRFIYEQLDGTILHEVSYTSTSYCCRKSSFLNGKAYVEYLDKEYNSLYLVELSSDGSRKIVTDRDIPETEAGWSQDCYLNTSKANGTSPRMALAIEDSIPIAQGYNSGFDNGYLYGFPAYDNNGTYRLYYKNYGCTYGRINGEVVYVLYDCNDVEDNVLTHAIALYDEIEFDNFPYLAVRDGEEYFYIDFAGNKVSDSYIQATSFNDEGYALVMETENKVCVINSDFQVLEEFTRDNLLGVYIWGNVFGISYTVETEDGITSRHEGLYYGTKYGTDTPNPF